MTPKEREVIARDPRLDADDAVFFARELESIKTNTYDVRYPTLKAKQFLPVSSDAGPGAESIVYRQYDFVGMAKIIANYADDLPRVGLKGKEFMVPVKGLGAAYGYSIQDIRKARMAGLPLEQRKANAARRVIELLEDNLAWFGDPKSGIQGLLYNGNVTAYIADLNAGATSTAWEDKTPDEIILDVNNAIDTPPELTNDVEHIDTLLIARKQYRHIATTPRSTLSDTTILKFLQAEHPDVNFQPMEKFKDLTTPVVGGGTTTNIMVGYRKDSEALTFEIPVMFEQLPVQARNLEFVVNCHARNGGVIVYYPLSVVIVEGI